MYVLTNLVRDFAHAPISAETEISTHEPAGLSSEEIAPAEP